MRRLAINLFAENLAITDVPDALVQALGLENVRDIVCREGDAFNSEVWFVTVLYQDDSSQRLLVKRNLNGHGEFEQRLYAFVLTSGQQMASLPICHYARYDAQRGISALVLEDLSATHRAPVGRHENIAGVAEIADRVWDSMLEALAQFHAHWWDSPHIGTAQGSFPIRSWFNDEMAYTAFLDRKGQEFALFRQYTVGTGYAELLPMFAELFERLPGLWEQRISRRIRSKRNIVLSQGDCFLGQFLVPRSEGGGQTKLVDFQEASANTPAFDLGYMLSFFPPANQRDTRHSLQQYHSHLPGSITAGYALADLLDDYRWILCLLVLVPIWDASYQGPADSYWGPKLRNVLRDFQSFDCLTYLRAMSR